VTNGLDLQGRCTAYSGDMAIKLQSAVHSYAKNFKVVNRSDIGTCYNVKQVMFYVVAGADYVVTGSGVERFCQTE